MNNSDLDDEMKFEISLIKIYNMIQENIEYESLFKNWKNVEIIDEI